MNPYVNTLEAVDSSLPDVGCFTDGYRDEFPLPCQTHVALGLSMSHDTALCSVSGAADPGVSVDLCTAKVPRSGLGSLWVFLAWVTDIAPLGLDFLLSFVMEIQNSSYRQ